MILKIRDASQLNWLFLWNHLKELKFYKHAGVTFTLQFHSWTWRTQQIHVAVTILPFCDWAAHINSPSGQVLLTSYWASYLWISFESILRVFRELNRTRDLLDSYFENCIANLLQRCSDLHPLVTFEHTLCSWTIFKTFTYYRWGVMISLS